MGQAVFGRGGLRIDGRYVPFVAGEFDYYRNNHLYWEPTLDLMKDVGLPIVSSFICWDFHEISPGEYDFDGRTNGSRNLRGFLDACAERELYVVARPGPIIDSDWETRGPAPDVCTLERLDPRFLARASQWIAAVGHVLSPYQITEGGPVALTVLDNSILFPYASDPDMFDKDGVVLIPYNEDVVLNMYGQWLQGEYKDIGRLNEAWGTKIRNFDEIETPKYGPKASPVQVLDSFEFINDRVKTYVDWVANEYQKAGIVVPTTTSERQFLAYIDWPRVGSALDTTGPYFHTPNLLPANQIRMMSWWARLQRAHHDFSWCPEFQAGWIGNDGYYGFISPDHDRYMGLLGLAFGIRGLSWFLFVERDDWSWSPINGCAKPRRNRLRQYEGLIKIMKQLEPDDVHLSDVGLIWTLEDNQMNAASQEGDWTDLFKVWVNLDDPKEAEPWWSVFSFLEDLDIDFVLYDPRANKPAPSVLIWASSFGMAQDVAERIAADVGAGSRLIAVTPLPDTTPRGERSETVRTIIEQLRTSERVRYCGVGALRTALEQAGARTFVSTEGGGIISLAYQGKEGLTIFVINNRWDSADVRMALDAALTRDNPKLQDLWPWPDSPSEAVWTQGSLQFSLRPKSVRILRLH